MSKEFQTSAAKFLICVLGTNICPFLLSRVRTTKLDFSSVLDINYGPSTYRLTILPTHKGSYKASEAKWANPQNYELSASSTQTNTVRACTGIGGVLTFRKKKQQTNTVEGEFLLHFNQNRHFNFGIAHFMPDLPVWIVRLVGRSV